MFTSIHSLRSSIVSHSILRRLPNALGLGLLITLLVGVTPANAALNVTSLTTNINELVKQGNSLVTSMNATVLSPSTMNSQLSDIEGSTLSYLGCTNGVYATVVAGIGAGSISITQELLTALNNLAATNAALGTGVLNLSSKVVALSANTGSTTLQSSLATTLRLSDDIGTMANRILEMADKILIMADNIGLMADRILTTQTIQSTNLPLVLDANLQTQTNIIQLITLLRL